MLGGASAIQRDKLQVEHRDAGLLYSNDPLIPERPLTCLSLAQVTSTLKRCQAGLAPELSCWIRSLVSLPR